MTRYFGIFLCCGLSLAGQTKRVLIVGIDQYQTRPAAAPTPAATPGSSDSASRRQTGSVVRASATGRSRDSWTNLEGAVTDATQYRQILIDRYGVLPENIVFLTDKKHAGKPEEVATAQRILDTVQNHLIKPAKEGDISIFVFTGHGSRMRNLGSDEADKMDQTLVPADSEDGTADIRDKELARLYRQAAEKKILFTVISDSCHSGGISRGPGTPSRTRNAPADSHVVTDPPDIDKKTGKPYPDPAESGYVLVISSALDNQPAEEIEVQGEHHGVFSYFFQQSLQSASPDESIEAIFSRATALMRAAGRMQVPQLEGKGRRQSTLLGTKASATAGISATVESVREGKISLRGGLSLGLQEGCELVLGADKNKTRIRIAAPPTLSSAVAQVMSGPAPQAGDIFVLDRWTVPAEVETRFYLPEAGLPSLDELRSIAGAIREAATKWQWVEDPTVTSPDAVIRFENGLWELERRGKSQVTRVSLGKSPTAADWMNALAVGPHGNLFVDFPPTREFVQAFRSHVDPGADAVRFTARRAEALYHLAGRALPKASGLTFEYAWVLAAADARDEGSTPLPIRSDWFEVGNRDAQAELARRTLNVTRLRLWLQVSVPGGGASPYPYSLGLRNKQTREIKTAGQLVEGEVYDLVLTSTPEKLSVASAASLSQWVYVAAIDQNGGMRPIFPRQLINSSANHLPRDGAPAEIVLREGIPVGTPFGTDTLILITSEEEIDPAALQIDPVKTRGGGSRGSGGSVSRLLFRMQGGSRGFDDGAPSNWNVQRLTFRSVEKPKAGG